MPARTRTAAPASSRKPALGGFLWLRGRPAPPPPEPPPQVAQAPAAAAPKSLAPKITVIGETPGPAPPHPAPAVVPVTVPDGTRLRLAVTAGIPAAATPGDVVHLAAAEDLHISGFKAVAKGAAVSAVLGEAGRKFIFGRSRKISILLDTVPAVDGTRLRLRGAFRAASGKSRRELQVSPPAGKRDGPSLAAGLELDAYIDGTSDVRTHK